MRVSLGHPPVLVTKKLLNHIHVISSLYEIRCEVMPEVMKPEVREIKQMFYGQPFRSGFFPSVLILAE
jgi:hypothetical protein